ncbi:uncharacterized protein LOC132190753 [Corylus avellana]|uniref:uncharacterized protein LOC132190753 n=1 Tax=Corylus avellana TaxID=13451 RepID=UPI00286A6E49|nr:uncharacterized protein LOC132190753 [Corylus avellana]
MPSGNAREWFQSLVPNSMGTFEDLARIFLTHFLGSRERKKPSGYLLTLHQQEGESLKEFMIRFNTEKLKVEDRTDGVIFSTIYNGISPEEPVVRKIAQRQLNNLQELLDEVEEFIKEEETLRAMRPPGAPQNQNSDHYCEFHEANGHYTEGCIALRHLIKKFIRNGKLVRFLGEKRIAAHPRENYVREVNYHQSRDHWQQEHYRSRSFDRRNRDKYPQENKARQEEPRKGHARLTRKPQNQANIPEIHTIIDRFAGGDALVVTLIVANHNVHRFLVDDGSSADILYWSTFKKLNLGQEKIVPTNYPLMGYAGEQVQPVGSIELQITAGSYPRQVMVMIRFLLVDRPPAYKAIIGRTALNELKAITSTLQLKIKFPTDHGVGEVKDD